MQNKKMLVVLGVLLSVAALLLAVAITYQAPKQAQSSGEPTKTLPIMEIQHTFRVPDNLGKMSYKMNGASTILLYSPTYEGLSVECQENPIAELQLSDKKRESTDLRILGTYRWVHLAKHPLGLCAGGNEAELRLYTAVEQMFTGKF